MVLKLFTSPAAVAPMPINTALQQASAETGVGFDYLFKTAVRESGMQPDAAARTSSATGLFQFIESTWLSTLKQEGPKHGLGQYASQIEKGPDGRYDVTDPQARAQILALRTDPRISALMAGALTLRNGEHLQQALGREASGGELYIAHFLGSGEAGRLLRLAETDPDANAAQAFPRAAAANQAIFYEGNGAPRSIAAVRDDLISRHEGTSGLSRMVARIERKVVSFFSSLFQFSSARREVVPGGEAGADETGAAARRRSWQSNASAYAPQVRAHPQTEAVERLAAKAAYDSQRLWHEAAHRPEDPVLAP